MPLKAAGFGWRGGTIRDLGFGIEEKQMINIIITFIVIFLGCQGAAGEEVFNRQKGWTVIPQSVLSQPWEECDIWVLFTDKGVFDEAELQEAIRQADISERAKIRRAKNGEGMGIYDVPILEDYKQSIGEIAAALRQESRWFNAVSASVKKRDLAKIVDLPFVAEIRPIARGRSARLEKWEEAVYWQGGDYYPAKDYERGQEGAFYGTSYDQLYQIGVIDAHRRGYYGDDVIVAVLDGGFMLEHRAFQHSEVLGQWDFIFHDDNTDFDPHQDVRGQPTHGTACMSNIGAYDPGNLIGCAPFAKFLLAKTEDVRSETAVEEDYWVAAVEWAERNGADVLSSSLSYLDWYSQAEFDGVTPLCSRAATQAFDLGVVICTSMGNEGPEPRTMGTPADAEGNVTVGAVDSLGIVTGFSSRGPTADERIKPNVMTMGRHVTVVRSYTYDEFSLANGTSFSCPLAAGALALLVQAHPDWSSWEILEAVENTATRAERPDNTYGYGILQIDKAMDYPCVSGFIKDGESGKNLADVTVEVVAGNDTIRVITGKDGFYKAVNLPEGKCRISAAKADYGDGETRTIIVPPDEYCDFVLKKQK